MTKGVKNNIHIYICKMCFFVNNIHICICSSEKLFAKLWSRTSGPGQSSSRDVRFFVCCMFCVVPSHSKFVLRPLIGPEIK